MGAEVDRAVRGQLRRVDQDPPAHPVDPLGQVVDRGDDAGDVRGARDREQRHPSGVGGEQPVQVVEVEQPVALAADGHGRCPVAPWELVGVVLERGRQHDRVGGHRHRARQRVDRLGRVRGEDHDVAVGIGTDEVTDDAAACSKVAVLSREG